MSNDVLPVLTALRPAEIRKSDINRVNNGIMDRGGGVQANRTHFYLTRSFNWRFERDYL